MTRFEDLKFCDDYMFCKVLTTHPELCRELLDKYSFENRCIEIPDLVLGDGTKKIFLCPKGNKNDVPKEMSEFLDWLATRTRSTNTFVGKLEQAVEEIRKSKKWRLQYMTLEMKLKEQYKEGKEAGKIAAIVDLIEDGIISIKQGASQLGVSEKEMTSILAARS